MKQPKTIDELQQWYWERNLPPEEITRFFIGKDIKEPKAFGIYQNKYGEFVVYKNKANGERAIRYQGDNEAFAVKEFLNRLKQEIKNQKSRNSNHGVTISHKKGKWIILSIFLGIFVVTAFIILAVIFTSAGDQNAYYSYKNSFYYYDNNNQWHFLTQDDTWIPVQKPGLKFIFFEKHPLRSASYISNCYVIENDYAFKCTENMEAFYQYNKENNCWENTKATNRILSAFLQDDIIKIFGLNYYYYNEKLFVLDEGKTFIYNDTTKNFDETKETLDTLDFLQNYREYTIDVEDGFYLYQDTVYYVPYTTCWKIYDEKDTSSYYKWVDTPVDKELILNFENYYLCDDRRGYYQFDDAVCYYQSDAWYIYEDNNWKEINPNELAKHCSEKVTFVKPAENTSEQTQQSQPDSLYNEIYYYSQYDTTWDVQDFADSQYYYDYSSNSSSYSSSSSDSSYNWDSGSSWDSGATNWSSDW